MAASEGVPDDKLLLHNQPSDELRNGSAGAGDDDDKIAEGDHKSELSIKEANGEADTDIGVGVSGGGEVGGSKIREDGFLLFRNICKLSMKFSSQETPDDQILLRGKILSLELLKVIMDNGGPIWRSNERQVTNTFFHSFLNSSHNAYIIIVY
jgi:brefeldin A-inhibited guanine nucleotide-exchange protein